MPYSPEHKIETRTQIVRSARRLFSRNGLSEVTIEQIMNEAGLTRGGFYKHFDTKEALYAEAIRNFSCDEPPEWQRKDFDPNAAGPALVEMIVNAYLSDDHLKEKDFPCPMIGLPSDVSRSSDEVKAAFQEVLDMMVGMFSQKVKEEGSKARKKALVSAVLCVGGMVLSRAMKDQERIDEIRSAVKETIFEQAR